MATTLKRSKGGQFALHAKALPGSPYDGHTLASLIPDMENTIGNEISRILADAGYRGHPRVKPEGRLYAAEPQVQGVYRGSEAPGHAADQARDAQVGYRTIGISRPNTA